MKRRHIFLAAVALPALLRAQSGANASLAMVAASTSAIAQLTPAEVRKLYLGVPLQIAGAEVVPMLNVSDPTVKELFLQKVLFTSAQVYERQLLGKQFRNGAKTAQFTDQAALVAALINDPMAVSFMDVNVAKATRGIKIIGDLWTSVKQ